MALPLVACFLLAGIHVYLGMHVLARKVIFVDLALAQITALGAVCAVVLEHAGIVPEWSSKVIALLFALVGALLISITRTRRETVPHEAIIGIFYAVALSLTILASANMPHGADELRELLSGSILWVRSEDLWMAAALYAAVGAFHYVFRTQMWQASLHPEAMRREGSLQFWDFAFYASFALVVTSSVSIAGVLLVFSFLVIPSVASALVAKGLRARLLLGWVIGVAGSVAGVLVSYFYDLPSGPAIVVVLAAVLVLVGLLKK